MTSTRASSGATAGQPKGGKAGSATVGADGGRLVVHAGRSRRPARVHTRIVTPHREIIRRTEQASLAMLELMPVTQLGGAGTQQVSVEIFASVVSGLAWAYANCAAE